MWLQISERLSFAIRVTLLDRCLLTVWLIEHCIDAHSVLDGTIGIRARHRLQKSENYEDLMLLAGCDRDGREPGVDVPDLDEALDYIRNLEAMYG